MQKARMLGNFVKKMADEKGMTLTDLSILLQCDENKTLAFLKGRAYITFQQMKELAQAFGVSVSTLLAVDANYYNNSVVHCMNSFQNVENRELILDIIDDYMDVWNAVQ